MITYLTELFSTCVGSESETEVTLSTAFRIGPRRKTASYPRNIIIKFPYWNMKAKILESFWEQSESVIEGYQISVFPDLSVITLKKRKLLKFLTLDLQEQGISYKWGLPVKLVITYNSIVCCENGTGSERFPSNAAEGTKKNNQESFKL